MNSTIANGPGRIELAAIKKVSDLATDAITQGHPTLRLDTLNHMRDLIDLAIACAQAAQKEVE